jgi:hypothetical protein
VEAWPIDALVIAPAASLPTAALGPIPEGVGKRNGVWMTADDEMSYGADRAEDEDRSEPSEVPSEPTTWLIRQDFNCHDFSRP